MKKVKCCDVVIQPEEFSSKLVGAVLEMAESLEGRADLQNGQV